MKRIILYCGVLCACLWQSQAWALCEVHTSNRTYADGTALAGTVCDENGALKVSGGGGGTQYAEDSAHVSGDSLTMAGVVQKTADAALSSDGDRSVLQVDENGYLKVNVKSSTGGGVSVAEDAVHANGENIVPLGCRRKDSAASSAGADGDWATVDCDANGALRVTGGTGGASVTEDAAHSAGESISPTGCRRIDTAASSAGTSGDWATLDCDSSGRLRTIPTLNTPNGDTMVDDTNDAIRVTGVTVQAVSGNVAHDSANTQSPVVTGGHASSSVAGETIVTNGDAVRAHYGRDGVQHVRTGCALEDIVSAVVTSTAGANTSGIAAQGAGVKVYLSQIIVFNNGSSNGSMIITDGSGGTTKLKVPFPASTGTTISLALPVGFSANTAIFVDPSGSDNIDVTLIGCKSQL